MQKVISINLNGNAYQLDESGYDALREYLARAEHELEDNPDRAEIMADLEQAIADKCQKFLGPHKSVVNASEVEQIVAEMGPVDAAAGEDSAGSTDAAADKQTRAACRAAAEAAVPDSGRRDDRGRLQRSGRLFRGRRHVHPGRVRPVLRSSPRASGIHRLCGDDVRHPRGDTRPRSGPQPAARHSTPRK